MKQGENITNEDFFRQIHKELKVYEKHGGTFLWGEQQQDEFEEAFVLAKAKFKIATSLDMSKKYLKEQEKVLKVKIKEKIVAMAIVREQIRKDMKIFR